MLLKTKHFGEIEINDDEIITFEEGLPGFVELKKFAVLYDDETEDDEGRNVFSWLQSVEDEKLCFVLVDAAAVLSWYKPIVDETELDGLELERPEDALLYNIARFPEDTKDATVNLMAPIVVNIGAKKGRQVIVSNDDYGVRHYLFRENAN